MLECLFESADLGENTRLARELRVISNNPKPRQPKPEWLRIRLGDPTNQNHVLELIEGLNLHTVWQEARCPNIFECWSDRTATFMLGGDICTRHCGFCAVGKGEPGSLDREEPRHVAEAVRHLNLAHTVITSVNRDDLADGGAAHWAGTIRQVRALNPECKVEVLIPDFNGDEDALNTVLDAEPDVLNHNTETIARLYRRVRPDADYQQSLTLLKRAAAGRESAADLRRCARIDPFERPVSSLCVFFIRVYRRHQRLRTYESRHLPSTWRARGVAIHRCSRAEDQSKRSACRSARMRAESSRCLGARRIAQC